MRLKHGLALPLLTSTAALAAAAAWSARIGRRVWSPGVFAWRNFSRPQPSLPEQADCPLRLVHPRVYSFLSKGSSIGSVFKLDVKNVSNRLVHSFTASYSSLEPSDTGSIGVQPEKLLQPEKSEAIGVSYNGNDRVTFSVDFVQFADGEVWYADPPTPAVKPEGVRAGAQAARQHLLETLDASGAAAVMTVLPRLRLEVASPEFSTHTIYGLSGFYCGVTNTVLRVERAYREGMLPGVERFLRH